VCGRINWWVVCDYGRFYYCIDIVNTWNIYTCPDHLLILKTIPWKCCNVDVMAACVCVYRWCLCWSLCQVVVSPWLLRFLLIAYEVKCTSEVTYFSLQVMLRYYVIMYGNFLRYAVVTWSYDCNCMLRGSSLDVMYCETGPVTNTYKYTP
jgi:hypothetical protein